MQRRRGRNTAKRRDKKEKKEKKTAAKGSFNLEDGVYKGTGTGYAGDITVSVLIKDKQIVSIDILSSSDDEAFFHACKSSDRQDHRGQTLDGWMLYREQLSVPEESSAP